MPQTARLLGMWTVACAWLLTGCRPADPAARSTEAVDATRVSRPSAVTPTTGTGEGDRGTIPPPTPASTIDPQDASASAARLTADVEYLASDALGGRGPFTEGLERAADHLAREFRRAGLATERFGPAPFQVFRTHVRLALGTANTLELCGPTGIRQPLAHLRDFTPLSLSASGRFDLPLVFVGYGITCPEAGVDDYAGRDVRGSMVVILRHAPPAAVEFSTGRRGTAAGTWSEHTHLSRKVSNAQSHGAAGVLLVTDAAHALPEGDERANALDPLLSFQVEGRSEGLPIPVLHCRRETLDGLLTETGRSSLRELEQHLATAFPDPNSAGNVPDENRAPPEAVLAGCRAVGEISIERRTLSLKNVLGELPGSGALAGETVIVGAHYDHLGQGGAASLAPWTRAIHNGADDNASGTAGLLEVARLVAAQRHGGPARRVLFVGFSAEEMGLIGSERFVAAPPVPLTEVVAMVNLDMIGRLRGDRLLVSGTGTAREFAPLVQRLATEHQFRTQLDPSGYGPSDHATFAARGIPVLHFFTGLHADYHRPSDDAERINIGGLQRISRLVAELVRELAETGPRPTPTGGGLDDLLADVVPRRSAPTARSSTTPAPRTASRRDNPTDKPDSATAPSESTPADQPSSAPRATTPRGLGISVYNQAGGRVVIRQVLTGGVAERAGLRSGDVIRRVGGSDVATVQELVAAVRDHVPGARELLRIERGTTPLEFEVVW